MKLALYHQAGKEPKQLKVIREHADGTVDLGNELDNLIVGKCKVVTVPAVGCATLVKVENVETKADQAEAGKAGVKSKDEKVSK